MNQNLLIFILFVVFSHNSYAQESDPFKYLNCYAKSRQTINSDSLLTMLSEGNPFHVLPHIFIPEINTKDCYYNDSLKSFLLKFLNKDTAYQYMAELAEHYGFDNNRDIQEKYIRKFLIERKQMYLLDTILKTPDLYSAYFDTVFTLLWNVKKLEVIKPTRGFPKN